MLISKYADDVVGLITGWNRDDQLRQLTSHLLAIRRQQLVNAARAQGDQRPVEELARSVAGDIVAIVETLPGLFSRLRSVAEQRSAAPGVRAALLSVVAYVAKPHDAIEDDGTVIGLIDDAAMVYGASSDFFAVLRPQGLTPDHLRTYFGLLLFGIPDDRVPIVMGQIEQMRQAFHGMQAMPPMYVDQFLTRIFNDPTAVQMLLEQPVQAAAASMPGGMSQPSVTAYPGGGSIMSEPGHTSILFPGGGGAAMVGGDIIGWD